MTRRRIAWDSSVPYYAQLRDIIAAAIDEGRWLPGELIPSEAELTATYQVSRTVIRKALDLLTGEDRVRRIKGKGTLVLERFLWTTSPELSGPYDALAATYRIQTVIENRLIEDDGHSRERLALDRSVPILRVTVISERSDQPGVAATLSSFNVAGNSSPALAQLIQDGKTPTFRLGGPPIPVQLATQFGLRLSHSPTTLSATTCSEAEAAHLGVDPSLCVFCFEWVTHDMSQRVVITGRSLAANRPRLRFIVRHTPIARQPPKKRT
jgi:GntR family transcriptional regulator